MHFSNGLLPPAECLQVLALIMPKISIILVTLYRRRGKKKKERKTQAKTQLKTCWKQSFGYVKNMFCLLEKPPSFLTFRWGFW